MKRTTLLLLLTTTLLLSSCTSTPKATTTTAATQTTEAIAQTDLPFGAEGLERGLFDGLEWGTSEEEIREKYGEENVGDDLSNFRYSEVILPYNTIFGLDNKLTINNLHLTTNNNGLYSVFISLRAIGNNASHYLLDFLKEYIGEPANIQLYESDEEYVWIVDNSAIHCSIDLDKNRITLFFDELEYYKNQKNSIFQK